MRAELPIPMDMATGGLLVLIRLSGMLVFVPIPGLRSVPALIRIACALLLTMALLPSHPIGFRVAPSAGEFTLILISELGLGLLAGVVAGLLGELFVFAVQTFALQAGYSYASSIDPNSEADSNVLQSVAGLASMLLFFHSGVLSSLLKSYERSLTAWPPGSFWNGPEVGTAVIQFGGAVLELALRLALPVVGLLLLTDLTLALLGRLNSQLQLLTLAFPVKMLGALAAVAAVVALLPGLYSRQASQAANLLERWVR